jgi:hypothetical protein
MWGLDPTFYLNTLYYDLVIASDDSFTAVSSAQEFNIWYGSLPIDIGDLSFTAIDKSGNRSPLTPLAGYPDGYFVIEGIKPDEQWRVLITTWADRQADEWNTATHMVALSHAFVTDDASGDNTLSAEVGFYDFKWLPSY